MLSKQTGFFATGADIFDSERLPCEHGKAQGGPKNLPAAFADGAVD